MNHEMLLRDHKIAILDTILDGFIAIDRDWRITYWNKEAELITGKTAKEILDAPIWDIFPQEVGSLSSTKLHEAMYEQMTVRYDTYLKLTNQWYSVHVHSSKQGLTVFLLDITGRKRAEQQLTTIAYNDILTSNQKQLKERLNDFLMNAKSNNDHVAVMILNLERFKIVDVPHICDPADDVMAAASRRLTSHFPMDTVYRYNGDNFAVLLPKLNVLQIQLLAERIITDFQMPFFHENSKIVFLPSIGISLYPMDGNQGENLLANAVHAMRRALDEGENNYQFYSEGMNINPC
ncbi:MULTISPECIES: diguanylate cyclase [unclassified Paenibacillus]|uniref:diguanylate cyclase domain-containing protein n=1 Tax=unclassified Paenibacillus TaxID=185978 RepID=UPI001AE6652C|nr:MULTISPECIES: diguanylate cyclase [unclassified Paenibacillus]MBP1153986.1 diguanylate cyclase (GGDEF)-like protein/PAS domain S-box-containing protein [Paenibacillus sp. PvP091]MBP1170629.1 diguanylate cyclase (GGDEF)-like protein/PAS domain S-box-containing protein [Paenibacillus sp. PvR098]MBP2441657.1 diguanylate cyclase (GGDEF)-like protein/PAS domain S-box-containing protein [Paenibacillus sp. PvP052]